MAQQETGLYSAFNLSWVYDFAQDLMGVAAFRKWYVSDLLRPSSGWRILDVGCGTARILDYLPGDVGYYGFDMNPRYIKDAVKRYGSRGHFRCERVSAAAAPGTMFDVVLANGLLHHLDDDEALKLVQIADTLLKPRGFLLTTDGVYVPEQSRIARFIVSRDRGRSIRTPEAYSALVRSRFKEIETQVKFDSLRIPFTHFIMKCVKS